MKLDYFILLYSKWIKDLYVRPETIKYLEENIDRTLFHVNFKSMQISQALSILVEKQSLIALFHRTEE